MSGSVRRRPGRAVIYLALAALLVLSPFWAGVAWSDGPPARRTPQLEISAPAALMPHAARLERFDPLRLSAVMRLVGLDDPGPAVRVFLLAEDDPLAAATPQWIVGFAHRDEVVLFPQRTPSYPHESLQQVLEHEVGHVLISRAAGGSRVPRWFHEGVAMAAERTWTLGAQAHFASEVAFGGAVPIGALDALFASSPAAASRAYRLSDAVMRDLMEQHGPDLPARVLIAMRSGQSFDQAFLRATGTSVAEAGEAFWQRRRLWVTWLPWVTSTGVLYALMTLIALLGAARVFARRRARRRETEEEQWWTTRTTPDDRERDPDPGDEEGPAAARPPWRH